SFLTNHQKLKTKKTNLMLMSGVEGERYETNEQHISDGWIQIYRNFGFVPNLSYCYNYIGMTRVLWYDELGTTHVLCYDKLGMTCIFELQRFRDNQFLC